MYEDIILISIDFRLIIIRNFYQAKASVYSCNMPNVKARITREIVYSLTWIHSLTWFRLTSLWIGGEILICLGTTCKPTRLTGKDTTRQNNTRNDLVWFNKILQLFVWKTAKKEKHSKFPLRWFPSFALRIPTAHEFCVISARTWACGRTKHKRFPSN